MINVKIKEDGGLLTRNSIHYLFKIKFTFKCVSLYHKYIVLVYYIFCFNCKQFLYIVKFINSLQVA